MPCPYLVDGLITDAGPAIVRAWLGRAPAGDQSRDNSKIPAAPIPPPTHMLTIP